LLLLLSHLLGKTLGHGGLSLRRRLGCDGLDRRCHQIGVFSVGIRAGLDFLLILWAGLPVQLLLDLLLERFLGILTKFRILFRSGGLFFRIKRQEHFIGVCEVRMPLLVLAVVGLVAFGC
jgi:hypothetical protein